MKITYKPNPLETIVELDDHEKQLLKLKIMIEQLEEKIAGGQYYLGLNPYANNVFDVDKAKRELDYDDDLLASRVDELTAVYIDELQQPHVGDCTCFAMSCVKCHAEQLVGVDTLAPYPGKHQSYHIQQAFSRWNPVTEKHDGPKVTLDQAIEKLANYKPTANWLGWETHAEQWVKEASEAHQYLIAYRQQHFSGCKTNGTNR